VSAGTSQVGDFEEEEVIEEPPAPPSMMEPFELKLNEADYGDDPETRVRCSMSGTYSDGERWRRSTGADHC
jgi:hypothetical protein